MARYPHILAPAGQGRNPPRVVCVDCTSTVAEMAGRQLRRMEAMTGWTASTLLLRDGVYRPHSQVAGPDAVSWWRQVDILCGQHGTTLIMSYRCNRVWSLLDLWAELENGGIVLYPDLGRGEEALRNAVRSMRQGTNDLLGPVSSGALRRLLERGGGCLIAEDPPNILRARVPGKDGRILWIDCRNWGVEAPATLAAGGPLAEWLAALVVQYASALHSCHLGSIQATAGSQALRGWRSGYYYPSVEVHCHEPTGRLERAGYYGGRCEAYRVGVAVDAATLLDIRSAYAGICVSRDVPVRLLDYREYQGGAGADAITDPGSSVADVALETEEAAYPYRRIILASSGTLPSGGQRGQRFSAGGTDIIYPVGRFRTVLPGPELADALSAGRVRRVYRVAQYVMRPALKAYAEAIYAWREKCEQSKQECLAGMAKRLLVSLPGKFGQRIHTWIPEPDEATDCQWGEWVGSGPDGEPCRYRAMAGLVSREHVGEWSAESVPAIAAWITSWCRVQLLGYIRTAGWEDTVYVDTDAIITDATGTRRLSESGAIREGTLGGLQYKCGPGMGTIYGIKQYTICDRAVCAGRPRGVSLDTGDGRHYWYSQSPADAARCGQAPAAAAVLREYQRSGEYRHGVVGPDGLVTPHRLEEW